MADRDNQSFSPSYDKGDKVISSTGGSGKLKN